jgi:NhaP-type Na+/H+ or K+/H+ antiporter
LATVVCGITYRAFGDALINDNQLICDFWGLVEHLLNTVLFALGGLVWGSVIANAEEREGEFTGRDWGE